MARRSGNRKRKTKKRGRSKRPSSKYEEQLLIVEKHQRPDGYPGLNAQTRRSASDAQFIVFYERYWPDWRHTKIRLYRRLLDERTAILEAERPRLKKAELQPKTVVYAEMTSGILASMASEFCQYAEDLAILVRASSSDSYFARDLAESNAGKMQAAVKKWPSIDAAGVASLLRIPTFPEREKWESCDVGKDYLDALERAAQRLSAIGRLYETWEIMFMRYKHGLLFALRSPGVHAEGHVNEGGVDSPGFPFAFDCGVAKHEVDRASPLFALPTFGFEDVRCNAAHLASERNLLRMVPPPGMGTDVDTFMEAAAWISQLQRTLLENRASEVEPRPGNPYYMPADDPAGLLAFYREDCDARH